MIRLEMKLQYNINKEAAKISALSSGKTRTLSVKHLRNK